MMTNRLHRFTGLIALALTCCICGIARAGHYDLTCQVCGTWNEAGIHTVGEYFIGFSHERPSPTAAYFVFDLTPVKGKTVTAMSVTIPGTTDYTITAVWGGHTPPNQFKVGLAPQNVAKLSIKQIITGNKNKNIYHFGADPNQNQDLGYNWLVDGLHPGFAFGAFYYNNWRFQDAVNAGGQFAIWACDRYDSGNTGEQYIWGGSAYSTAIVMHVTTSN